MTKIHNSKHKPPFKKERFIMYFITILSVYLLLYNTVSLSPISNHADRTKHTFKVTTGIAQGGDHASYISYYHCGPKYLYENSQVGIEILLLRGAKFTKEDWRKSGLLQTLCEKHYNTISVTAADLSVSSDGKGLMDLFDSLSEDRVISGRPLNVVTPSASGKSVVSLAEYAANSWEEDSHYLERIINTWVPIASGNVLQASEESLTQLSKKKIPVLALNGKEDIIGSKIANRLVQLANAEKAEINGGHSCYFENPDDFVRMLFQFFETQGISTS